MDHRVLESLSHAFHEPQPATAVDWVILDQTPQISDVLASSEGQTIGQDRLGLIELILKDPVRLDRLIRQPQQQINHLPRLLATSLAAFTVFGISMTLVFSAAGVWPHLIPLQEFVAGKQWRVFQFEADPAVTFWSPWLSGNAFRLIAAYAIGLIAATGICLPSLYFYSLLAGVRMTMMDVVIHALKSKAVAAVTLIGVIPIYAAFGMATAIFPLPDPLRDSVLFCGLLLPFIAGLSGTYSLYRGLSTLTDTMNLERRRHRECFLQRLVLSWSAVYTAVSPVLIFTLWQRLQG